MIDIVSNVLYVSVVTIAVLLIFIILMQRSKSGGGLGGLATTNSSVEQTLGADAVGMLMKATIFLSILFFVNVMAIAMLQVHKKSTEAKGLLNNPDKSTGNPPEPSMGKTAGDKTAPAPLLPGKSDSDSSTGKEPASEKKEA
ncbi:MAG: preprotein translocase subunit SecG, partial [Lentisphaeria bacterium]|nr:preprotein translocase subunit SecG [Lentisphaeria bacterium]